MHFFLLSFLSVSQATCVDQTQAQDIKIMNLKRPYQVFTSIIYLNLLSLFFI